MGVNFAGFRLQDGDSRRATKCLGALGLRFNGAFRVLEGFEGLGFKVFRVLGFRAFRFFRL